MRKSVFAFAVIAAACSSVAFAGEVKQDKAQVVKATTMSDAQMDKVTAGAAATGHAWGKQGLFEHPWQGNGGNALNAPGHNK